MVRYTVRGIAADAEAAAEMIENIKKVNPGVDIDITIQDKKGVSSDAAALSKEVIDQLLATRVRIKIDGIICKLVDGVLVDCSDGMPVHIKKSVAENDARPVNDYDKREVELFKKLTYITKEIIDLRIIHATR